MNVWKWAIVGIVAVVAGCTGDGGKDDTGAGDDDDDATACGLQAGTWSIVMTLEAGADPMCPDVPPDTFDADETTDTTDDCDPSCECSLVRDDAACTADMHQECVDGGTETIVDCQMAVDGDTLTGACDIAVTVEAYGISIDCAYTVTGELQG